MFDMEFEWYKRFEVALVLQTQRYTRIELKLKVSQLFLSTPKHFFRARKAPIWGLPGAKM